LLFTPYGQFLAAKLTSPPVRILEIACGTGRLTQELTGLFPTATIVATDISPDMLAFSRRKIPGTGNIVYELADAQDLAYPDASFDVVVAAFVIMIVPDKHKALAEARRVLAPGGKLVFSVWSKAPMFELVCDEVEKVASEEIRLKIPFMRAIALSMADSNAVLEMLHSAGFTSSSADVAALKVTECEQLARGIIYGSPFAAMIGDANLAECLKNMITAFGDHMETEAIIFEASV
jgi:ubiquinone/menaquinone biosynthesis C-methylase UbiE